MFNVAGTFVQLVPLYVDVVLTPGTPGPAADPPKASAAVCNPHPLIPQRAVGKLLELVQLDPPHSSV